MIEAEHISYFHTPIGWLELKARGGGLCSAQFVESRSAEPKPRPDILREARKQLKAYFAGELTTFDLNLTPSGTAFQHSVWTILNQVPFGKTTTYAALAKQLGGTNMSRAIGSAMRTNPIVIIQPCHRVLGQKGDLTGFVGGLDRKRHLLDHEARMSGTYQPSIFEIQ